MWVAQQMGHADWTMIARVYGRWIPDAVLDAGGKAVATFGNFIDKDGPLDTGALESSPM